VSIGEGTDAIVDCISNYTIVLGWTKGRCWSSMAGNNVLVVPPFDCAWLMGDELRFAEDGRGCVAFEARADNDVTVVFKEHAGACSMEY
jgi:hypothetical protein